MDLHTSKGKAKVMMFQRLTAFLMAALSIVILISCKSDRGLTAGQTSMVNSVSLPQEDINDLEKWFKNLTANLVCDNGTNIASDNVSLSVTGLDLMFVANPAQVAGETCLIRIEGEKNENATSIDIQWTAVGDSENLLYASQKSIIGSDQIDTIFYKTYVVNPNLEILADMKLSEALLEEGQNYVIINGEMQCSAMEQKVPEYSGPLMMPNGTELTFENNTTDVKQGIKFLFSDAQVPNDYCVIQLEARHDKLADGDESLILTQTSGKLNISADANTDMKKVTEAIVLKKMTREIIIESNQIDDSCSQVSTTGDGCLDDPMN